MRKPRSLETLTVATVAGLLAVAACGAETARDAPPEVSVSAAPDVTLADVEALGIPNASIPLPNLIAAEQPTEEQVAALVRMGFRSFISLREPSEIGAGWEETRMMDLGEASFSRIPVRGAEGLTRENVEALDRLLDEAGAEKTVLYCGSGNRVGALLALRAAWLEGATPEEALELGRGAGLRSLEPAVAELLGVAP